AAPPAPGGRRPECSRRRHRRPARPPAPLPPSSGSSLHATCRAPRGPWARSERRMLYLPNSMVQYLAMAKPSDSQAPRAAPGRPKDLAKRGAILDAARQLFLEHGFAGVSMDQIAARAGVSKLT